MVTILTCVANTQNAGTISETDTACVIDGWVKYSDGKNVSNAEVVLHLQKTITSLNKTHAQTTLPEKTDSIGFFKFDSIGKGNYLIEINDSNFHGALVPLIVKPFDTLISVKAVVTQFGCIIGKIDTAIISFKGATVLYVPELNRTVHIDSSGNFVIPKLPEWNYQLLVVVKDSIIRLPTDSLHFSVLAGDTTRISSFGSKSSSVIIHGNIVENPKTF
jgi:hypothetical protein